MKKSFLFITSALFSAYSILAQANTVHSVHVSEAGVSEKHLLNFTKKQK